MSEEQFIRPTTVYQPIVVFPQGAIASATAGAATVVATTGEAVSSIPWMELGKLGVSIGRLGLGVAEFIQDLWD